MPGSLSHVDFPAPDFMTSAASLLPLTKDLSARLQINQLLEAPYVTLHPFDTRFIDERNSVTDGHIGDWCLHQNTQPDCMAFGAAMLETGNGKESLAP
jgi:hypothetical protein